MTIDWSALEQRTSPFTALDCQTDPVSGLATIVFCGLRCTLSQVMAAGPASGAYSVAIFADTLVADVAAVKTSGLVVMAREIDVSGLAGRPLEIDASGGEAVVQMLVGGVAGGALSVAGTGGASSPVVPDASARAASMFTAASGGALSPSDAGGVSSVRNLVGRSWSLNALKAGYAGATHLIDRGTAEALGCARAMLSWVAATTSGLAGSDLRLPSDYAELYNQAAALLMVLDVRDGATFVPVLSPDVYGAQMEGLVQVLRDYEGKAAALAISTDIAAAITTIGSAVAGTAADETAPLQLQLDQISERIDSLYRDVNQLRGDFMLQTAHAHTAFEVMLDALKLDDIKAKLQAELDGAMTAVNLGFDCAKMAAEDTDGLRGVVNDGVAGIRNLVALVEAAKGTSGGDDLSAASIGLMSAQDVMMRRLLNGRLLWRQAMQGVSGAVLPGDLAGLTSDPSLQWDTFLAAAEAQITTLQRSLGAGGLEASDTYRASLQILAGYGKAVAAKFSAYVGQLVQATILIAQIKAAKDVEARWQAVTTQATGDAERLAALRAVVGSRADAVKRAIYVSWTYYAASYFYLNFSSPPRTLHIDADAAAIADALTGVAAWVSAAAGATVDGQHVRLPNDGASVVLEFEVVAPGGTAPGSKAVALAQATTDGGWTVAWTVPLGTDQLAGVLPNGGKCAVWITEARFTLVGAQPNAKGNLIANVATSGSYQNGFGPSAGHTFATNGLSGDYAYDATGRVYSPWRIDSAIYMTPTPYTQWTMTIPPDGGDASTAQKLRMELTVAYSTQ